MIEDRRRRRGGVAAVKPHLKARSYELRLESCGEGSAKRQGKTVVPRNWRNNGITMHEPELEVQCKAFEANGVSELLDEASVDKQKEALAF